MTQESRQHGILEKHDSAAECGAYTDAPERDFFIDAPERHYNADAPELDFYIDGPELDQTSSISHVRITLLFPVPVWAADYPRSFYQGLESTPGMILNFQKSLRIYG